MTTLRNSRWTFAGVLALGAMLGYIAALRLESPHGSAEASEPGGPPGSRQRGPIKSDNDDAEQQFSPVKARARDFYAPTAKISGRTKCV